MAARNQSNSHTPHSFPPEMEGLGTYFCLGVKDRAENERPRVTVKLAFDRWVGREGVGMG